MISSNNDRRLSQLAVRLRDTQTKAVIGTGLLYYHSSLIDKVYVMTAAHNFYEDTDIFQKPRVNIIIEIYNPSSNIYQPISHDINYDLVSPCVDKDVAVLLIDASVVTEIVGVEIPSIYAIKDRFEINSFVVKGFPMATQGEELACIYPSWGQALTVVNKFQLHLKEDYTGYSTQGFSGSGAFLYANKQLYLYGIFTRFLKEDKGKVIYCQYIDTINELLHKNYLPLIEYTFIGNHGLTPDFFQKQIQIAINDLGPRFNEDLNFRLPIAWTFNDLVKDDFFKERLIQVIDKWLTKRIYGSHNGNDNLIQPILEEYEKLKEDISNWISALLWEVEEHIDFSEFKLNVELLNQKIESKRSELFDLQREEQQKQYEATKRYDYPSPYEHEISKLNEIYRSNDDLIDNIEKIKIVLSNHPCLLIQGEAGTGKSHLLGDIASKRLKNNKPTLLLLGQYFKNSKNVWENIIKQLQIHCTKEELLDSLNNIGKQINSRVLILIDAINEGSGKEIWPNELAGFIHEIKQYPFIGLALTVRSTYFKSIVPENLQNNSEVTHITHHGFKGNEYAALLLFCKHFELELPSFPILSPEFTNPLFLQLICIGVKNSGQKTFPQKFQNVTKLFKFYLDSVCKRLAEKRDAYKSRDHIIIDALKKFAIKCFENENRNALIIRNAVDFFDQGYDKYRDLYNDLVSEGVLIQKSIEDYNSRSEIEVVYFAYERFGDFIIVQTLLDSYETKEEVLEAFEEKNKLGILLGNSWWRYQGIFEAFSILLPERFNLEIVEVYDWAFEGEHQGLLANIDEWLSGYLIDSLKWRNVQNIDDKKLRELFENGRMDIDNDSYFYKLTELTSIHDHPFNSDRLFKILIDFTMPERDAFWQKFLRYFSYYDDNKNAYPIRRLIDWAWHPSISSKVDIESARLVCQTLAWVLSSTDRRLRDQTTKAMVNLLEEQPDALIKILAKFKDINDTYISERLYAVAYGCILRTSKNESISKIAQFVFDAIFKDGNPPTHILLRDYARNIIEYAFHKRIPIVADITLIRPPYKSEFPSNIPSNEEIEKLEFDYNDKNFKNSNKGLHNRIIFDVMEHDFGRKEIESALDDFCPYSFTMETNYKLFLKTIGKSSRESIKLYESILKLQSAYDAKKSYYENRTDLPDFLKLISNLNSDLVKIVKQQKIDLKESEYYYFKNSIIPHLENKKRLSDWQRSFFDASPIKKRIVQRVFDLGYDYRIHGDYDSTSETFSRYHESNVERIGKKYQWIAFHEIMGVIADNFKIKKDGWTSRKSYYPFQGPWQLYLRDIDPVFITKNRETNELEEGLFNSQLQKKDWWFDSIYNFWDLPNSEWAIQKQDLPDPRYIVLKKDEKGVEWIYLNAQFRWEEPKAIGVEKYDSNRKEIKYFIYSYLVKKTDKRKILNWLKQQNFWGLRLPRANDSFSSLFNRENYWSPVSKSERPETWSNIDGKKYKVKVTTSSAVGELSDDKSNAHFRYDMPCKTIFDGINLQYAPKDGEFKNQNGEIVVLNPDYDLILIQRKDFQEFLDANSLDLIWILEGEKMAFEGNFHRNENNHFKVISGVYSLEDGIVSGSLRIDDRI